MSIPSSHIDSLAGSVTENGGETQTIVAMSPASDAAGVAVPSASFISSGQFERDGSDLKVSDPDGNTLVVKDYFSGDASPDLISPDGTQYLTPSLVDSFLTPMAPGQYAQALPAAAVAPIGQVLDLEGEAVAVRADGTRVPLGQGDPVYEGDVIETAGGSSAIRMVFSDETEFSLGADARLALDQLVFNPDTQAGSAQFSILKGVFVFASGQIAKTDNTDMTVSTPVATIGIRGTEVAGRVAEGDSQFTIIDGAIQVTTRAGSVTLDDDGETTRVAGNDTMPSDPVLLTPAQFEQAYGEVSGVVSNYFNQSQPDGNDAIPGGGTPSAPGDSQPETNPDASGDRADSGALAGATMLASTLPADAAASAGIVPPSPLPSALANDVSPFAPSFGQGPLGSDAPVGANSPADAYGVGLPGGSPSGGNTTTSGSGSPEEVVVAAVPAIGFADNITFSGTNSSPDTGTGNQSGGPAGFNLAPPADVPGTGVGSPADGPVQVSFSNPGGVPGAPVVSGQPVAGPGDTGGSAEPPLDMPSGGSSGSPFRSESGGGDAFAGNPYVSQPFGYAGPQLGDVVFDLVAGDPVTSEAGSDVPEDDPNTAGVVTTAEQALDDGQTSGNGEETGGGQTGDGGDPDQPEIADVVLTLSNATLDRQFQDLSYSFEVANAGVDSFVLISGQETDLPHVRDDAQIEVARDADGNVDVELTSAWNSVKNIRAESDSAADIRIDNFVHADIHFGDGGDSHISITDAKRGFVTTGDGNDKVEVEARSDGSVWSNLFDVRTGAGDDTMVFEGASNGRSELYFDGGAGTDTLYLTGPGQSFDLSTGQLQIVNVERIDISGNGSTTLTVPSDLFKGLDPMINPLTGTSQTLVVDGEADDTIDLQGDDWAQVDTAEIDGESYAVYENASGARVAADSDVQVA